VVLVMRTMCGESDLRSFAGGFMIPEGAREGTVLDRGEELVESGEVGAMFLLVPSNLFERLLEVTLALHRWYEYGQHPNVFLIDARLIHRVFC